MPGVHVLPAAAAHNAQGGHHEHAHQPPRNSITECCFPGCCLLMPFTLVKGKPTIAPVAVVAPDPHKLCHTAKQLVTRCHPTVQHHTLQPYVKQHQLKPAPAEKQHRQSLRRVPVLTAAIQWVVGTVTVTVRCSDSIAVIMKEQEKLVAALSASVVPQPQ